MAVPESIRNYRNIGASILLFLGQENSPSCRRNSQHAKEIDGSPSSIHSLRLAIGYQAQCQRIETRHTLERFALFLDLRVFRERHQSAASLGFEVVLHEVDNAPRLFERKRLQQHGIDDAENRRICSNPERQRKNRDSRESRILPQHPQSKSQVLP